LGGSFGASLAAPATIAKEIGDAGTAFKKKKLEAIKTQTDALKQPLMQTTSHLTPILKVRTMIWLKRPVS